MRVTWRTKDHEGDMAQQRPWRRHGITKTMEASWHQKVHGEGMALRLPTPRNQGARLLIKRQNPGPP